MRSLLIITFLTYFIKCHDDPYLALDCDKHIDIVTNELFNNRLMKKCAQSIPANFLLENATI
jgi:hypothetical protein